MVDEKNINYFEYNKPFNLTDEYCNPQVLHHWRKNENGFIVKDDISYKINSQSESQFIPWRTSIWDLGIFRSLQIWNKLPFLKICGSLGLTTKFGTSSIKGKLSSGKDKYFVRDESGKFKLLAFKNSKSEKIFKPFSLKAIEICRNRANEWKAKA